EKNTLFDMASITKPVATATSIMMLVEQGAIRLKDKVSDHLPEFGTKGKDKVTIQQLLTHVGGLIPDNSIKDYQDSPEQSIKNFLNVDLNYEPEKDFKYSDVGFLVLGELVHRKTGKNVHQFSQENIFRPLGMTETMYLPPPELAARAATTEQREGGWMIGQVHDPRAYALGGVAGHAGLFSTATDLAVYAQMMLNQGVYHGVRILGPQTVRTMTAAYDVPKGARGLGWDKRTGYSVNRGETMTASAFGHGGFTGTGLWIDPELDLFVIFLSNRVHPDGKGLVNPLIGTIGNIVAASVRKNSKSESNVLAGIDVLQRDGFSGLNGRRIGLITNHTGMDQSGVSTVKRFHECKTLDLVALFSPEHGFAGKLDQEKITDATDPETGKPVFSLYGENRKPTVKSLEGIDTLVFDIQDIGARFYTYISTMGGAMEVAAENKLRFVVLDRPNPINGIDIEGPMLDDGLQSFVAYHKLPIRHGMTVGEIAEMLRAEKGLGLDLRVIRCEGWSRGNYLDATGMTWVNPSPNMRNLNQALLYPGIGMLEYTNLSVGRGTDTPFEHIGAPWLNATLVTREINSMQIPGVRCIAEQFTPTSSKFQNQNCSGIHFLITDRNKFQSVRLGLAVATALKKTHPKEWESKQLIKLLGSAKLLEAIDRQDSFEILVGLAREGMPEFVERRAKFLMY
ncbi:MAG: exo-beta-N-acetylmuramidase NamZ domain-containing protein, partial [Pirellula sp.]